MTAELHARGHRVNHKRVERLMRTHHIAGIPPTAPQARPTTAASTSPESSASPPQAGARAVGRPRGILCGQRRRGVFFSSLKQELVNRCRCPDRSTARRSVFEWLARYNTTRRNTSLTPDRHEAHYRHTAGSTPALST